MPSAVNTETCPHCNTTFRVEADEDGFTEIPETKRCTDLECEVVLCPCCPQAKCDGCNNSFCPEHLVIDLPEYECNCEYCGDHADSSNCLMHNPYIRDLSPTRFCVTCLEESEQQDWPDEIPAKTAAMYRRAGLSETEMTVFEKFLDGRVA